MSNEESNGIAVKDIEFTQVIPQPHLQPEGLLPNTKESCALWMFLVCAFQALHKVPAQVTLESELDQQASLMQIAHSQRKIYKLDSLEGMFNPKLIALAKRETRLKKLPWNSTIDVFFHTAGKTLDILDRDANKVGQ